MRVLENSRCKVAAVRKRRKWGVGVPGLAPHLMKLEILFSACALRLETREALLGAAGSCWYSRVTTRSPEGFSSASRQCFWQRPPRLSSGTVPSPSDSSTPLSILMLRREKCVERSRFPFFHILKKSRTGYGGCRVARDGAAIIRDRVCHNDQGSASWLKLAV